MLLSDLRIAARSLARTPGFTSLATLVLALGLAVVVVMFAILWQVSYEPPPLPGVDRMVGIKTIDRRENDFDEAATGHDFEEWRQAQTVFSDIAGVYDGTVTIIQPLIEPLYEGRTAHELLAVFSEQYDRTPYDIVKSYWQAQRGAGANTQTPAT